MKHDAPEITVVISSRNSRGTIRQCIESARAQTLPVDIIVVDNASVDGTPDIARSLGCAVIDAGPERSRQRNVGAAASTNGWLLFVDSDMIMAPGVAASCLTACRREGATAAVIPQLAEGEGFFARARALEKKCYVGDPLLEAPRFFDRCLFEGIGGYDEDLYAGEDWDIAARTRASGTGIARSSEPLVHLDGSIGLLKTFVKMRYYGRSMRVYATKHPALAKRQMSPLRPALLNRLDALLRRPDLAAGILILKLVELAGMAAGMGAASLRDRLPLRSQ